MSPDPRGCVGTSGFAVLLRFNFVRDKLKIGIAGKFRRSGAVAGEAPREEKAFAGPYRTGTSLRGNPAMKLNGLTPGIAASIVRRNKFAVVMEAAAAWNRTARCPGRRLMSRLAGAGRIRETGLQTRGFMSSVNRC